MADMPERGRLGVLVMLTDVFIAREDMDAMLRRRYMTWSRDRKNV